VSGYNKKNKFAALENLDDNGHMNRECETIRDDIKKGQSEYRPL
jgi:hypothetical protein